MATASTVSLFPPIKWAQRREYVLLTIDVQDTADVKVELKNDGRIFAFSCSVPSTKQAFACEFEFFRQISPEESQHAERPRAIEYKLKKMSATRKDDADEEDICWPRLTKGKTKNQHIQVDWGRWKDEDEDDVDAEDDLGDFGMGGGGIDYSKMMSQFMVNQGNEDAEGMSGGLGGAGIPNFGSAAGQQPIGDDAAEEDDDMPPLEDD